MTEPLDPKSARFRSVADAVCSILLQRGPGEIKVTRVARSAGVSRAWIYKNFGVRTTDMLDFAIREIADAFAATEHARDSSSVQAWRASIEAAIRKSLVDVMDATWPLKLYMRYRHTPDAVGDAMRVIESRYIDAFLSDIPREINVSRQEARAFSVLFINTRMNLLHCWPEERLRRDVTLDQTVEHLMDVLDAWLARHHKP